MPEAAGGTAGLERQQSRSHDVREGRYSEGRRNEVLLADQAKREAQGEQPASGENARHGHAGGARHKPGDRAALSFPLQAAEESENADGDDGHKNIPGRAAGFLEQGEDRRRGEENNDAGAQGFEKRLPERLFPRPPPKMRVSEQVAARAFPLHGVWHELVAPGADIHGFEMILTPFRRAAALLQGVRAKSRTGGWG